MCVSKYIVSGKTRIVSPNQYVCVYSESFIYKKVLTCDDVGVNNNVRNYANIVRN
ncbi:hypothetical protein Hanom_Chr14g01248621 [Helianthus anomalus]